MSHFPAVDPTGTECPKYPEIREGGALDSRVQCGIWYVVCHKRQGRAVDRQIMVALEPRPDRTPTISVMIEKAQEAQT